MQLDDSNPFQQTYTDAQKFTSGRNYKIGARELMNRGASAFEDDPNLERVRNAGRILSEREYRKDFEKGVKGYGYDLRATPGMATTQNAEKIKSDIQYRKEYETKMKGKGAFAMDSPQMKAAMAAQEKVDDGVKITDLDNNNSIIQYCIVFRAHRIID